MQPMTASRIRRRWRAQVAGAACVLCAGLAHAQQAKQPPPTAIDSVPGSSRPVGVGLSPESPPTPPALGGRAPSFGAPVDPDAWALRIGGRFSASARVGLGRAAKDRPATDDGTPLHTPPLVLGRSPLYSGTAASLNFQYGNSMLMAFVSYEAALTAPEWEGYQRTEYGPRVRSAFVTLAPPPLGRARFRFQVGAFPVNYGAPGPWGWGVFGPVLAVHGYGGVGSLDYELSGGKAFSLEYGLSAVGEVPEGFVRGTFTQWPETGLSTIVHHAHAGFSFKNKYFAKLHLANADGNNLRRYIDDDPQTAAIESDPDGRIQVAALELRWMEDPFGQLGITPVFWNMKNARSVHDGIWWGLDWTAGGRDMTGKFLGPQSAGTGQIAAVSAEYDFSLKRLLAHPKPFDGNGPDLRVALAFLPFWTLDTDDAAYRKANGYFLGATLEHVITSWLSTTGRVFGESRDSTAVDTTGARKRGDWTAFSASLGLALHSDWQSQDRMELMYSRHFYSDFTDNNPAQPLDRNVFTLGASMVF